MSCPITGWRFVFDFWGWVRGIPVVRLYPQQVPVADTTGAGDAFFSGVAAGLTYGKPLPEACAIGTRLASSVICSLENTCPRFLPSEFGFSI